MVLEFEKNINPIAVFINTFPLVGAISGIIEKIMKIEIDALLIMYIMLSYILTANLIRLVKRTIKVHLNENKIIIRSMFGWYKYFKIDESSPEFFIISKEYYSQNSIFTKGNISIKDFFDAIRVMFNFSQNSNLYYKKQLIFKGVIAQRHNR